MGRIPAGRLILVLVATACSTIGWREARAQEPPPDGLAAVVAADRALDAVAEEAGARLWPGYRPDTIPVAFTFPDAGTILANWPEDRPPEGYARLSGAPGLAWRPAGEDATTANTAMVRGGRDWAFVRAAGLDAVELLGIAAHEAFHAWQAAARRAGRYRPGENSFLVMEYPEFDAPNETAIALEGRLLAASLAADDPEERRESVHRFLAVREMRHRRLGPEIAAFETATELNEGVAQYVQLKATELAAASTGLVSAAEAEASVDAELDRLGGELVTETEHSLRRRFYTTGAAMAYLLDEIAGPDWKEDLAGSRLALHDVLAEASGYRAREAALVRSAREERGEGLESLAETTLADRREDRRARAREALSGPGLVVELAVEGAGLCGIDPQNLLQIDHRRVLHARILNLCLPGDGQALFRTPAVQDREGHTVTAVVGPEESVEIRAGGEEIPLEDLGRVEDAEGVEIDAEAFRLRAPRATLERGEGRLRVEIGG